MAIQVGGNTVIDNGRNFIGVGLTVSSIYISGNPGTSGQVIQSTGSAIEWGTGPKQAGIAFSILFGY